MYSVDFDVSLCWEDDTCDYPVVILEDTAFSGSHCDGQGRGSSVRRKRRSVDDQWVIQDFQIQLVKYSLCAHRSPLSWWNCTQCLNDSHFGVKWALCVHFMAHMLWYYTRVYFCHPLIVGDIPRHEYQMQNAHYSCRDNTSDLTPCALNLGLI